MRTKHAAKGVEGVLGADGEVPGNQKTLWADIRFDNPDHIIAALQQRRLQILGDCKQLKTDGDSFNENHNSGKQINMIFNFKDDLAELDQPTDYRPAQADPSD